MISVFDTIKKGCDCCEEAAMQGYDIGYERGYSDAQKDCEKKIKEMEQAHMKRWRELVIIDR